MKLAKQYWNISKLKSLLDEKQIIIEKIKNKLRIIDRVFMFSGIITCISMISSSLFSNRLMAAILISIGFSSAFIAVLMSCFEGKIKKYYEKKYGLNYKTQEIKKEFNMIETQKKFFNYIKEIEIEYTDPKLTYEITCLKLLLIENPEKASEIIQSIELILNLTASLKQNKKANSTEKLLEYNNKIGLINENNQEIEYSSDFKKIL